jgi:hypothetical protein
MTSRRLAVAVLLGAVACTSASTSITPRPSTHTPNEIDESLTEIEDARERWEAADVGGYSLDVVVRCFCPKVEYRTVVDADGTVVEGAEEGAPETVEDWHVFIDDQIAGTRLRAKSNEVGVPVRIVVGSPSTDAGSIYLIDFQESG